MKIKRSASYYDSQGDGVKINNKQLEKLHLSVFDYVQHYEVRCALLFSC